MIAIQRILSLNYNVSNIPGRRAIRQFPGGPTLSGGPIAYSYINL